MLYILFVKSAYNALRYITGGVILVMIKSFKCRETQKIWFGNRSKKLPGNIQNVARRKLRMINAALTLTDISVPPNNRLERLKGHRKGIFSIRVNRQWRICFKWYENDAYDVEIVDYH